jgi:hypothetical protein
MRRLLVMASTAVIVAGPLVTGVAAPAATAATGAPAWTSVTSAHVPPAGFDTSTAFDGATGQLVAYDESGGCTPYATWTWDGTDWTLHQQLKPPALREESALGYDVATKQLVMFGGYIGGTCPGDTVYGLTNETWTWNGSIWAQQHPATAPSARYESCDAYDDQSGQFIGYGGAGNVNNEPVNLADTWSWTGTNWVQLTPASTPSGGACSMTYDPLRKVVVMLVMGPRSGDGTAVPNQTWTWNGTDWTRAADVPSTGGWSPIAFDAATGTDISYSGQGTCTTLGPMESQCVQVDQTWAFDGTTWTQAPAANNPEPGDGFAAAYDDATHQYVIIGGVINYTEGVNAATLLYAAPGSSNVAPTRVAGASRQATAVAVSASTFSQAGSASAVVLARADVFADALAGGPFAATKHAPLLLTSSGALDAVTKAEIQRVLPAGGTVYLLGGTSALSDAVASAVTALGYVPTRVAGSDRYGTAVAIADAMGDPSTVFEASGTNFPDALSAVPAAIAQRAAILLTNGSAQASATSAYLTAHATTRFAVGGPAAWADPAAIAIAGADRYDTSGAVASAFFPAATGISVASGISFPDALAGGVAAGNAGEPMLLVPASGPLPEPITAFLATQRGTASNATVYGGTAAVANSTMTAVAAALR